MKTILTIFFYLLIGLTQSEVNTQLSQYETRDGFFSGDPAIYIYDNDITHVICLKDSVVYEVGAFIPKEYYGNYIEFCDTTFQRVSDDMFYYENYRVSFFKAVDPGKFVVVCYEGGSYDD